MTPTTVLHSAWAVWFVTWWAAALWSERSTTQPAVWRQIQYRLFIVAGVVLLFGLYDHRVAAELVLWRLPAAGLWICVAGAMAGFAFTWWARLHLGRLWSSNVARKAEHRVVDTGPYAVVRHPIYTGIILSSAATALARGTALGWLGAPTKTTGWYVQARMEERFLRQELGEEAYDAYARRVPMLVPFLR